jgi:hypothetical protein
MHPDRPEWPPTRLDLFSLLALAVVVYSAVEHEWIMVGVALFAILIAVILPRMKGPFEVGGPVRLKGELIDPQAPRLKGVVDSNPRQLETDPRDPVQPPALPETRQPHEG